MRFNSSDVPAADKLTTIKFPGSSKPKSVCVVGLGYIGLPTASVLADCGYRVHGVDVRPEVVETINRGEIHIHEPHLDRLVNDVVERGNLTASLIPQQADVFVICVPTPINADHTPDLTYVRQAARAVRPFVRAGNLVLLESTGPPGTTENVVLREAISEHLTVGEDVFVAYCPERVLPGRILIEVIENDRIVGGVTPACARSAASFYESFIEGKAHTTKARSAEIVKLAENAYRDVNIAFANELSMLAEGMGCDPIEIIESANRHPRVNILNPGPGVGGHCISVDPWFLVDAAPADSTLIRTARQVNDHKPSYIVDKVASYMQQHDIQSVGCLGLSYKADVDDLRESPSLEIVRELRARQLGDIRVCDPYIAATKFSEFPLFSFESILETCEMLLLLTDHREFREVTLHQLEGKHTIDTRGTWRHLSTSATIPMPAASETFAFGAKAA